MSLGFNDPAAYQIPRTPTPRRSSRSNRRHEEAAQKLAPDRFEDIIAVLALYRPGPLGSGMVDDFILRKKGQRRVDYFHPDLTACRRTYGVILYQEQVMQISRSSAATRSAAPTCCAGPWKKPQEMAGHRNHRRRRRQGKGYDPAWPNSSSTLMTKFAGIRLQQVAHRRLRGGHLPHRLAEGAPLCGLHGGDPVVRPGQHRHHQDLLRRRAGQRHGASLPPDINEPTPFHAGGCAKPSVTASCGQGHRASWRCGRSSPARLDVALS